MSESTGRRTTDATLSDIERMIMSENDPEKRAMLIVLNAIAVNLHANTQLTKDVSDKFDTHLKTYDAHTANQEALLNRGRGAWKVFAWVMTVAQALIVFGAKEVYSELGGIHTTLQATQVKTAEVELRLQQLEGKK